MAIEALVEMQAGDKHNMDMDQIGDNGKQVACAL